MIGQYGGFDYKKYYRDFRDGFYGIEACLFATSEDCSNLIEESKNRGFHIGIHFPFRSNPSRLRDVQFLSPDQTIRESAFNYIQEELDYLTTVQPDYVLFHYPKPVILDDRVNWDKWRFADPSEYIFESKFSFEELVEKSEYLFKWLTEKSQQYNFIPILEFDALNKYIYDTDFLEKLLFNYPTIKLCLDTGRLFLQEKIDPNFDSRKLLRKYLKYAYSIHLWTLQIKDSIQNIRHPVLPELSPNDGWAPIEDYLKIISEENNKVRIMFEHRSELISDEQLEQCYLWVDSILNKP
jgi:sugar phosphate isomerase/epimerase